MDNDSVLPLGYYAEVAIDTGSYFKGRIAGYDDNWIVIDPIPDPNSRTSNLVGKRWWVPVKRVIHVAVAPSPPQQDREAEAEPARARNQLTDFGVTAGDLVTWAYEPVCVNPRAG